MTNTINAQISLEETASTEGFNKFIQHQERLAANEGDHATVEGRKLVAGALPLVAEEITKYLAAADTGKRGKRPLAITILSDFGPEKLAYAALSAVYEGVVRERDLPNICINIGKVVESEMWAKIVEDDQGSKKANSLKQKASQQGSAKNRMKAFKKLAKDNIEDLDYWSTDKLIKVGEPLLNAVLTAIPDIFEMQLLCDVDSGKFKSERKVILTDEGLKMLSAMKDASAWLRPAHKPMVVMPRRWEAFDTGCYYSSNVRRHVHLVRTHNKDHRKLIKSAVEEGQMQYALEAINTIQETPWAINTRVLEIVKWAYENDIHIEGLPRNAALPTPPKFEAEVWAAMDDKAKKGHRIHLSNVHEQNRTIVGDKAVFSSDMNTAEELSKYDRFYLPQNMDFRGRVYPIPHFNNQRADHIKALFHFADALPLGPDGAWWLAIHLANCGDFNKMSKAPFEDRISWVEENEDNILATAADPAGSIYWWGEADSPFCFLAACFEYAEWIESGRSQEYLSRIPVALDGSNSGLQHYSASMRAEDEASFVSLLPCAKPADLYQIIADVVNAEVAKDLNHEDELTRRLAQVALNNGVNRSLVKRNVMTYAYSSAQFGFRNQIIEDTVRPQDLQVLLGKKESNPYAIEIDGKSDGGFKVANYLSGKIYRAVTRTVSKAEEGMTFFKQVAGVLAHESQPLVWTNPLGMPIMHKYAIWDVKRVELFLFNKELGVNEGKARAGASGLERIRANIATAPTSVIDKHKARSAVAPNVIHSMDGAHLLLTVLAAAEEGFSHFALIHDSFGTHAGRTSRFFQIIREAFVGMYESYDPFEEILESAKAVLSDKGIDKLPTVPMKGTLDLNNILDAEYAFA